MTDEQPWSPQGGFVWDRAPASAPRPPRNGRRRWWLAAVVVVAVVAAAGTVTAIRLTRHSDTTATASVHHEPARIGTPPELLLPSLRRQPVPGWHLSAADIGLPPGEQFGWIFGHLGDRAFGYTGHDGQYWVYGFDARTGQRLWAPLHIDDSVGNCYVNGPTMLVCVNFGNVEDTGDSRAWVINPDNGAITYAGPTELESGKLVGEYLVESVTDKGVYGIGAQAQHTWFVPGSGLQVFDDYNRDVEPPTLAAQLLGSDGHPPGVVFSVVDGTILTPTGGDKKFPLQWPTVYAGGFGFNFDNPHPHGPGPVISGGIRFFDPSGAELAQDSVDGLSPLAFLDSPEMPAARTMKQTFVYTADGTRLLELPPTVNAASEFRTIGTRFFFSNGAVGPDEIWQYYDLLTKAPGPQCHLEEIASSTSYLGSDGKIILVKGLDGVQAIDTDTCDTLWSRPQHGPTLFRVKATLIQVDDEDIASLIPPAG